MESMEFIEPENNPWCSECFGSVFTAFYCRDFRSPEEISENEDDDSDYEPEPLPIPQRKRRGK